MSPALLRFLGFLLTVAALAEAKAATAGSKPNVILIMTDDQGYGDIARYG